MDITLHPMTREDKQPILAIFNHYVLEGHSVFFEAPVAGFFYDRISAAAIGAVVARNARQNVIGFGLLRPYNPASSFKRTVEFSCFLSPDYTGKGIGSRILDLLLEKARRKEIRSVLAAISDRNPDSIRFHTNRGFSQCGHFHNIFEKRGVPCGVIWMQRHL